MSHGEIKHKRPHPGYLRSSTLWVLIFDFALCLPTITLFYLSHDPITDLAFSPLSSSSPFPLCSSMYLLLLLLSPSPPPPPHGRAAGRAPAAPPPAKKAAPAGNPFGGLFGGFGG
eukprot:3068714-Rhodomonas_salina.2